MRECGKILSRNNLLLRQGYQIGKANSYESMYITKKKQV